MTAQTLSANDVTGWSPDVVREFNPQQLRQSFGDFATGVTVLACNGPDLPSAITVNAFTSVSLDPPLVLVSLARTSRMLRSLGRRAEFSINVLAANQETIARCYGGQRSLASQSHWDALEGLPVVAGAATQFGCSVVVRHNHGDHTLLIAQVDWINRKQDSPALLFHRGKFGALE